MLTTSVISPVAASVFALVILTAPLYLHVAASTLSAVEGDGWKKILINFLNLWSDVKTIVPQMFFRFAFLAHEAALVSDAILRIVHRTDRGRIVLYATSDGNALLRTKRALIFRRDSNDRRICLALARAEKKEI